jgi:protoporphyrinogen oxidase
MSILIIGGGICGLGTAPPVQMPGPSRNQILELVK